MNPWHRLLLGAYGGLWRAAQPILRRHTRLKDGFAGRLLPEGWPFTPKAPAPPLHCWRFWIQAASGGEAWLAHSLIPAITGELLARLAIRGNDRQFHLQCLCTTFTRQGLEVLEKLAAVHSSMMPPPLVLPRFFPLDRPDLMREAVRRFMPQAVILLETELWPGLMSAAHEAGIPLLILNGRMTEKSLAAYRVTASFWRAFAPSRILAVSEADAERYRTLYRDACSVDIMPNIKFDRVALNSAQMALTEEAAPPGLRARVGCPEKALLAVLASVREEEEDLLLGPLKELAGGCIQDAPLMLALAPRHMHRIEAWKAKLSASGIPFSLRSSGGAQTASQPLCLWDCFGELQALYAIADAAFVGGSLAPLGGQNYLEPAGLGLTPLVGPYRDNFLWVGEDIFTRGLAIQIQTPGELTYALRTVLAERRAVMPDNEAPDSAWRTARMQASLAARQRFAAWLDPHTGGSAQAARAICDFLPSA